MKTNRRFKEIMAPLRDRLENSWTEKYGLTPHETWSRMVSYAFAEFIYDATSDQSICLVTGINPALTHTWILHNGHDIDLTCGQLDRAPVTPYYGKAGASLWHAHFFHNSTVCEFLKKPALHSDLEPLFKAINLEFTVLFYASKSDSYDLELNRLLTS
jgi:hypothetical protein